MTGQPISDPAPLSFGQERLWLLDQLGSEARNEYLSMSAWRVLGPLDVKVLVRALEGVVRRHEVLRTRFVLRDGVPVAVVDEFEQGPGLDVEVCDAVTVSLEEIVEAELGRPFELDAQWPVRCRVLRGDGTAWLVVDLHHIACDGWSWSLFKRDLGEIYRALVAGEPARLPALSWTYADFAVDQRERARDGRLDEGVEYWVERLRGSTPTELPSLVERPSVWCSDGATQQFVLDAEVARRLQAVAKSHRASVFMVLLAGFFLSLHEMTGETDLVVGSPIAGRDRPETAEVIGFFVNTLPLRVRLDPASSFGDFLAQVRECCLEAYTHADVPFDTIVNAVNPQRDLSRNPLFQIMFELDEGGAPGQASTAIQFEDEEVAGVARVDLQVAAVMRGDSIRLEFTVATAVCDPAAATEVARVFLAVLVGICEG